jgi:hypothetical protein
LARALQSLKAGGEGLPLKNGVRMKKKETFYSLGAVNSDRQADFQLWWTLTWAFIMLAISIVSSF